MSFDILFGYLGLPILKKKTVSSSHNTRHFLWRATLSIRKRVGEGNIKERRTEVEAPTQKGLLGGSG